MQQEPSVFGLPVAHAAAWIFNAYAIEGDDGLVVVDPGLPIVAHNLIDLLTQRLDRTPADVTHIACTHGHPDHVGGVTTLNQRSGSQVYLPERCRSYLGGDKPRTFPLIESSLRFLAVYGEQPFSAGALREFVVLGRKVGFGGPSMMQLDFVPNGFLVPDRPLPGASSWTVLSTPGHTDDSTCLYHEASATLISGDTVVTQDGAAWFNPEYVDSEVAKRSEEKLRSLEVQHLLPGHGAPVNAPNVWTRAKSSTTKPSGSSILARCSRRFGRW